MSSPPQFYVTDSVWYLSKSLHAPKRWKLARIISVVDKDMYLLEEQSKEDEVKKCFIVQAERIRGMGSTIEVLLDNNRRRDRGVTFDLQRNQVWYIEARIKQDVEWRSFPDND
ncbi:hypothetical protein FIBSPDRAFT_959635 [Athelia psychrophila]|uniref:Uncharacterized protein n=1 Tax=Athelia psychrophila TaxID=1759441 RepID=A0A166D7Z2_9AGAM|nr:hypothetical protein FIBSPDRAFT_959635 [Fibularhizoctonia sp. CBS 109695]